MSRVNKDSSNVVPVVLFVFNRHKQLQQTLECLKQNKVNLLYVFADGPRDEQDDQDIAKVRALIDDIGWAKKIIKRYSKKNKGLSSSIQSGLNDVFSNHKKAIIIEDDICIAPGFYEYITAALDKYESDNRIFGVTGLRYPFRRNNLDSIPDSVFLEKRFCSWGWATWSDRWWNVQFSSPQLFRKIDSDKVDLGVGGEDLPIAAAELRKGNLKGAWDVYCFLNMLINKQYFVWPKYSLVENTGLNEGTHVEPNSNTKWTLGWEAKHLDLSALPSTPRFYKEVNKDFVNYFLSHAEAKSTISLKRTKHIASKLKDFAKKRLVGVFGVSHWYLRGHRWLSCRRLASYCFYKAKRLLHQDISFYAPSQSDQPIDVYMPTIEKDAKMLGHALDGIRRQVVNPVKDIYVVAPRSATKVQEIAKKHHCKFIDESSILPFDKNSINYVHNGENRNGWIYKMLLNLYADKTCKQRYILILDSDTVFIRPQVFIYKGKPLFNLSDEYHRPYFEANKKILGLEHKLTRSFITHYMLFDAEVLKKLRTSLEEKWHKPWHRAITDNIDKSIGSSFADYEIYGDYFTEHLKLPCIYNYWNNVSLGIDDFKDFSELAKKSRRRYGSISLHNYERD